jgi:hypothetical protein
MVYDVYFKCTVTQVVHHQVSFMRLDISPQSSVHMEKEVLMEKGKNSKYVSTAVVPIYN